MNADQIFYDQEMDRTVKIGEVDSTGGPISNPVGTSSKTKTEQKENVHGKDALKKIREFNPALYEVLSKAYKEN